MSLYQTVYLYNLTSMIRKALSWHVCNIYIRHLLAHTKVGNVSIYFRQKLIIKDILTLISFFGTEI